MTTAELRELLAKATPGPWEWSENGNILGHMPNGYDETREVAAVYSERDDDLAPINAQLILAMHEALPALLAAVEEREWRPIESAPKNAPVIVFAGGSQFVAWLQDDATDPWHSEGEAESDLNGSWCVTDNKLGPFALRGSRPTHWQPLPAPPVAGGGES